MGFFIEVRCLETNETFQFSDFATITYCRIDNSPIRVPQGPAWCNVCNRIQMAEVFPQFITLQERYIEAAKLDPTSESAFIVGERESMEALEIELRELKAYLRKRTAGPKCLTCFSERIQIIPDQSDALLPDGKHYVMGNCGFADFVVGIEFQIDNRGNKIHATKR